MTYIEPNSTIRLIRNCPLDPTQDHTILFSSAAQQTTYFTSTLTGYTLPKNTYQRVMSGKMRVAKSAEDLYNCNYLAFQNTTFNQKWFYAFVTEVAYVNNVTAEITYELDPMQTWLFDYELEACFVEREHSATDNVGDNLVPEDLETGDYITTEAIQNLTLADYTNPNIPVTNWKICLFATRDDVGQEGQHYQYGIVSGLYPVFFDNSAVGAAAMEDWLELLPSSVLLANPVVCGVMMPPVMITAEDAVSRQVTVAVPSTLLRTDGTQVKNNKCLTYPYNFLYATNYTGKGAVFRYEFFDQLQGNINFWLTGKVCPAPSLYLAPVNYKSPVTMLIGPAAANQDEAIELTGFPQVSWDIDSFKAWIAQNASSVTLAGLSAAQGMASSIGTATAVGGAAAGAAGAGLGSVVSLAVSGLIAAAMPPQAHGSMAGTAAFTSGRMTFGLYKKHITPEFATIIDDYFTRFGYACKKIKVPNRHARPEWNYVKTLGCCIKASVTGSTVTGGLPASAMRQICEIYDRGITFWINPDHIGDYSYSNAPITTP